MAEEVRSIEILGTQYPIADTVARADATDAKAQAQQAINAVTQGAQNIAVSFKSDIFMSPPNSDVEENVGAFSFLGLVGLCGDVYFPGDRTIFPKQAGQSAEFVCCTLQNVKYSFECDNITFVGDCDGSEVQENMLKVKLILRVNGNNTDVVIRLTSIQPFTAGATADYLRAYVAGLLVKAGNNQSIVRIAHTNYV